MTGSPRLDPIDQKPRYRLVAESLAARIRAGDYPAGTKMPADKDLVDQLRVSRTTVREAMIALELMGLVVTRYGAGAFVAAVLPPEAPDLSGLPGYFELVEARFAFEPEIAAIAAGTLTPAATARLRAAIEGMCDETATLAEVEACDRDFHLCVAQATGNAVFAQVVGEFWHARQQFPEWTRLNNRQGPADIARFSRAEHQAILDALAAGDAAAARAAMQLHCRNSGQPLLERWRRLEEEGAAPQSPAAGRVLRRTAS
ncbi:FadR/GntR family transcriptional regulator [Mangrovicoccus algicola]|uniref:FadR family transcriptional regulator n=1 Tax=Mangrovicoccus algicola TaxID=2771008 RepID=A0A8J7CYT6_9RHOB|nr:FadR/GntR family transcriptional regulator [Mangrovicoccus algicola]MBE3639972.1 FadR family transcriptional regulator [Mangrovicoccus algicola]